MQLLDAPHSLHCLLVNNTSTLFLLLFLSKMQNIVLFQPLKCEDLLLFFVYYISLGFGQNNNFKYVIGIFPQFSDILLTK